MLSDPVRTSQFAVSADAAPRPENVRPRSASPPRPAARSAVPAPAPQQSSEDVRLQWDDDSGVVIKFTDKQTGAVMRQIPSEQMLSVAKFIRQMLQGQKQLGASSNSATDAGSSSGR